MSNNSHYGGPVLKAEYDGGYFYLFLKSDGKREELPSRFRADSLGIMAVSVHSWGKKFRRRTLDQVVAAARERGANAIATSKRGAGKDRNGGNYIFVKFVERSSPPEAVPSSEWAKRYMDFVDKSEAGDSGSEERGDS